MSKQTVWVGVLVCVGVVLAVSGCKDKDAAGAAAKTKVGAEALNQSGNADEMGLAIGGYCPVSYLKDNEAVKGDRKWRVLAESGATFYTVSKRYRDYLDVEPEKFMPAYGGWCAYAMATENLKVKADPASFKVVGGRTFLFRKDADQDALTLWNQGDEAELIKKADEFWDSLPPM